MANAKIKVDTKAWNKTFDTYVRLRKKDRDDMIIEKAARYAFEVYKALPAVEPSKIVAELSRDKLLLKIAVTRLVAKNVSLKGKALTKSGRKKARRKIAGGGTRRALTPGNWLVKKEAQKILASRKKSPGYHRVAYLLLSQKLRGVSITKFNPRSFLAQTTADIRRGANNSVVRLLAVARGLNCPSTGKASAVALQEVEADMRVYIKDHLDDTARKAGFGR
jgi:hypothetical protein